MLPRRKSRVAFWERRTTQPLYGLGVVALLAGVVLLPQPANSTTAYTPPAPHPIATVAPAILTLPTAKPTPTKAPTPKPTPTRAKPTPRPAPVHTVKPKPRTVAKPKPRPRVTHTTTYRRTVSTSGSSNRAYALSLVGTAQFQCLDAIWSRESGWSTTAENPSGAYGIPQALPASKMASAGSDWRTNGATQIRWGISYIDARYGSPCAAWSFWQSHSWY